MKNKIYWLLSLVMVLGMVMSACAPAPAAEPVVEEEAGEVVEATEEPKEEAEVEETPTLDLADLDAPYSVFLADMEKYNPIGLDALNTMLAEGQTPFILDVRGVEEAEEVAQDAFVRAWNALADFREEARFSTWLYRIVTRRALDVAEKEETETPLNKP